MLTNEEAEQSGSPDQPSPLVTDATHVSRGRRVSLWLVAWGLGSIGDGCADFRPSTFLLVVPDGTRCAVWGVGLDITCSHKRHTYYRLGVYLALSVYGLKQRQRTRYMVAYTILIALLIVNVAGCRYEVAHIHIGC